MIVKYRCLSYNEDEWNELTCSHYDGDDWIVQQCAQAMYDSCGSECVNDFPLEFEVDFTNDRIEKYSVHIEFIESFYCHKL
jgi:hypothetical protein